MKIELDSMPSRRERAKREIEARAADDARAAAARDQEIASLRHYGNEMLRDYAGFVAPAEVVQLAAMKGVSVETMLIESLESPADAALARGLALRTLVAAIEAAKTPAEIAAILQR